MGLGATLQVMQQHLLLVCVMGGWVVVLPSVMLHGGVACLPVGEMGAGLP